MQSPRYFAPIQDCRPRANGCFLYTPCQAPHSLRRERRRGSRYQYCEIDLFKVFLQLFPSDAAGAARYFRGKSRLNFKAYRGVRRLLKSLKDRGAKLYILSNAQACFTRGELEKLKFLRYFDGIELSSVARFQRFAQRSIPFPEIGAVKVFFNALSEFGIFFVGMYVCKSAV